MTRQERQKPDLLNGGRRLRIAKGSGTSVADVNALIKQFAQMRKMMKMFKGGNMKKLMRQMGGPGGPAGRGGGMPRPF
jgi:signal recognition particle subunit SRP54